MKNDTLIGPQADSTLTNNIKRNECMQSVMNMHFVNFFLSYLVVHVFPIIESDQLKSSEHGPEEIVKVRVTVVWIGSHAYARIILVAMSKKTNIMCLHEVIRSTLNYLENFCSSSQVICRSVVIRRWKEAKMSCIPAHNRPQKII